MAHAYFWAATVKSLVPALCLYSTSLWVVNMLCYTIYHTWSIRVLVYDLNWEIKISFTNIMIHYYASQVKLIERTTQQPLNILFRFEYWGITWYNDSVLKIVDYWSLEMASGTPPVYRTRSIWDSLSAEEFEQLQAYTKCKAVSSCSVCIYNCAVPK